MSNRYSPKLCRCNGITHASTFHRLGKSKGGLDEQNINEQEPRGAEKVEDEELDRSRARDKAGWFGVVRNEREMVYEKPSPHLGSYGNWNTCATLRTRIPMCRISFCKTECLTLVDCLYEKGCDIEIHDDRKMLNN